MPHPLPQWPSPSNNIYEGAENVQVVEPVVPPFVTVLVLVTAALINTLLTDIWAQEWFNFQLFG